MVGKKNGFWCYKDLCFVSAKALAGFVPLSLLIFLFIYFLTRKMGIENLPGSVVRINRHSAVGTAGAAPSTAQAACTLSPMVNPTHASRLGHGLADHHQSIGFDFLFLGL